MIDKGGNIKYSNSLNKPWYTYSKKDNEILSMCGDLMIPETIVEHLNASTKQAVVNAEKLQAAEEKIEHLYKINHSAMIDNANLAEENKTLREAVEYAVSQKEQDYGMESVYDIHQFRQRKVFSILEEALEKLKEREGEE